MNRVGGFRLSSVLTMNSIGDFRLSSVLTMIDWVGRFELAGCFKLLSIFSFFVGFGYPIDCKYSHESSYNFLFCLYRDVLLSCFQGFSHCPFLPFFVSFFCFPLTVMCAVQEVHIKCTGRFRSRQFVVGRIRVTGMVEISVLCNFVSGSAKQRKSFWVEMSFFAVGHCVQCVPRYF